MQGAGAINVTSLWKTVVLGDLPGNTFRGTATECDRGRVSCLARLAEAGGRHSDGSLLGFPSVIGEET
jgi:hypothetical protein